MRDCGKSRRYFSALCAICALGLGLSGLAIGQSATVTDPNASSNALQEIVVTAEKRAGSVQETPISLTAISGADLTAQGISSPEDALRQVPGVALADAGPGQTEYSIRGLSSVGPAVATVGFYLDDAPMTPPTGAQNGHVVVDPSLYDLNRIEVLRGPQGTLYGSSSMGGTIKLVTNQPDSHGFSAGAKVDGSHTESGGFNYNLNGVVNVPIVSDRLALRVVATDAKYSGWIDRIVAGNFPLPTGAGCGSFAGCNRGDVLAAPIIQDYHDVNTEDVKGVRGSLRFDPTEQLTLTASAFYQRISQADLSYYDSPPGTLAHYQPFDIPEPFSDTFRLYNLVAEFRLPAVAITSATSYWTRSQSQDQDVSEGIQTLFAFPSFYTAGGGVGPLTYLEDDESRQFSEEVRLASTDDRALQWLVGGFYSDYHFSTDQTSAGDGFVPLFGSDNLFAGYAPNHLKQKAGFGEASYKFPSGLKATAGLRYYSYTQNGSFTFSGIAVGSLSPATTNVYAANSGLNPKFTLSFDVSKELMVYGTAAKGFRPGAGNQPIPVTGPDSCIPALQAIGLNSAPTQYNPDSVWSYELGEKATLWDKRLTLNSAAYYERWTNVQQQVSLSCGFAFIGNVGTSNVRGAELELNVRLSPSWTLGQSGSYTHAVVASSLPGTNVQPGDRLLNIPTYNASTSLIFEHPVSTRLKYVARMSNVAVGSSINQTYFRTNVPAYDIADFRTGITADKWSAFLFVDNVTNKTVALFTTQNYLLSIPSLNRIATNQPRTYGVSLQYNY